ncbi:MAG: hypothetical protein HKK66_03325 [Chlorobiaceae bacterium]|nr:hypothetical protein [Chlorobiaceae bacterium]
MAYKDFITINVIGIEEARARLGNIPDNIQTALTETQTLSEIGTILVGSAVKTIDAGGRPSPYKPLAASTVAAKIKKYKKNSGILIGRGTLRQSLDYEVSGGYLYLTSVGYLKYHQFEEGRTRANFPARPVWGVQEEDIPEITDIIIAGIKRNL